MSTTAAPAPSVLIDALRLIHDEADHALGTDADPQDRLSVARQDLETIREIARTVLNAPPPPVPLRLLTATRYAAELIRATEHEIARLDSVTKGHGGYSAAARAEIRDNAERQAAELIAGSAGLDTLPDTLRRAADALQCAADAWRWQAEVEAPAKGFSPAVALNNAQDAESALASVRGELAKLAT